MKTFNVAVVGVGAVGQALLDLLSEHDFPVKEVKVLATSRSAGKQIQFQGKTLTVQATTPDAFEGVDIALFAGGGASKEFARFAVDRGAVVIDNSSYFRMDPEVPLVVPEVNSHDVEWHKGIIANPNCSTIQMVVALKPLHQAAKIKRIVVSTYQAVSGAGSEAMEELREQSTAILNNSQIYPKAFPYQISFNVIPHIDVFLEGGYTKEEIKMVNETKKIMGDDSIKVTATTVRVPVFTGHSESVNIETEKKLTAEQARKILASAPGVTVVDDVNNLIYPMPKDCVGLDDVFVGRIREDDTIENGLNLWIVSDNLRKGAATNAVQIASLLVDKNLV